MKHDYQASSASACEHSSSLIVQRSHVSRIVAALILISFFIFIAGYFWGKKRAIDEIAGRLERDTFADRLHRSMSALYDIQKEEDPASDASEEETTDSNGQQPIEAESTEPTVATVHDEVAMPTEHYYAALVGFGSERNARSFVNRWRNKGIDLSVAKRTSTTARGKQIAWYQVVTPDQPSYQAAADLAATIQDREKLHDVKIIKTTA